MKNKNLINPLYGNKKEEGRKKKLITSLFYHLSLFL